MSIGLFSTASPDEGTTRATEGALRVFRLFILTAGCTLVMARTSSPPFDLLIHGGLVFDGTGSPAIIADVAVSNGRIVATGNLSDLPATRVLDAGGLAVAPGFIDMMGGWSEALWRDPISAESKLRQGITTMMVGEGASLAPRWRDPARPAVSDTTWSTFAEYFRILERKGIALNVVHNVGATQVRMTVMGEGDRRPTAEQLESMRALVGEAMNDGAVGLSTALIYPPGCYATTEEIVALAQVVAQRGGVYFSHVRNEGAQLTEAIDEALRVGREAGIPVHIFHLKAAGTGNWPLMIQAISRIAEARLRGERVTADMYPYLRNVIGLDSFIPPRYRAGGRRQLAATLSEPELRHRLRQEIETTTDWDNWYRNSGSNWDNVLISSPPASTIADLNGLSIHAASQKRQKDVWSLFFDLVPEEMGVYPLSMNEEQKHLALRAPFVCFGSDFGPINPATAPGVHPRAVGCFPRILAKYVREEHLISLEEAIRKMTSLPADILQLLDRGRISPGKAADLVIFNPETIRDNGAYAEPVKYSQGVEHLLVNGRFVIEGGRVTSVLPGQVLRHHGGQPAR